MLVISKTRIVTVIKIPNVTSIPLPFASAAIFAVRGLRHRFAESNGFVSRGIWECLRAAYPTTSLGAA